SAFVRKNRGGSRSLGFSKQPLPKDLSRKTPCPPKKKSDTPKNDAKTTSPPEIPDPPFRLGQALPPRASGLRNLTTATGPTAEGMADVLSSRRSWKRYSWISLSS